MRLDDEIVVGAACLPRLSCGNRGRNAVPTELVLLTCSEVGVSGAAAVYGSRSSAAPVTRCARDQASMSVPLAEVSGYRVGAEAGSEEVTG